MPVRFGAAALTLAGLFTISCSGIVDPSKNVTETFTGTVKVQGSDGKPFSTGQTGEYSIKVTALDPPSGTFFGVIYAPSAAAGTCTGNLGIYASNSFAQVNITALSGSIYPGNYCVYIYDNGSFTKDENYTVQVSHP
jgi:hypothetical protein